MLAVFQRSVWARVGVLVGLMVTITLVVAWNAMTPAGHQYVMLKLAGWFGLFVPALVFGGIWGWIKYSRSSWTWATAILVVATVALIISRPDITP